MLEFKTEKVTDRITRIYAFCTELIYLVEGEERAALLDTGSGFGSLKAAVDKLTDKPVTVLLTHGHTDHAMGSLEFSDVYLNLEDEYIYHPHGDRAFRHEGMSLAEDVVITEENYIETAPFSLYNDMKGGDSFDLGGVTIEIYDCPGHTRGSVVMLIKEERALLLGDACNGFTFLFQDYSLPIETYEENLKKLKPQVEGKYDIVLSSHGDGRLDLDIIDSMILLCEDIKHGNVDDVPMTFRGDSGLIAKAMEPDGRVDGGHGNIVYNKENIWNPVSPAAQQGKQS